MSPEKLPRIAAFFLYSLMLLTLGVVSVFENWAPARVYGATRELAGSLSATGAILPQDAYVPRRAGGPTERFVVPHPELAAPGYLLISRLQLPENRFVTELVDGDGTVLNSWDTDYPTLVDGGAPGTLLHPMHPLPDGSLLVAYDQGKALARLDACGQPVWIKTDQTYHHSIRPDEDAGGFWVWQAGIWYGGDDQRLVRFDADTGDIVESIDLLDDIVLASDENRVRFGIPDGFAFNRTQPHEGSADHFHPNDIQPLPARLASAFPQFKAGDLLISLRNLNLLAVIDRDTKEVLWAQNGPWQEQHDPDWQADGTITVFSNNQRRGLTTILQIDPTTNVTHDLFAGTDLRFFSIRMGQHQSLPNGNWLITSAMGGTVMEVTPKGVIVRELSNPFTGPFNGLVAYGQHLPPGFYDTVPSCTL